MDRRTAIQKGLKILAACLGLPLLAYNFPLSYDEHRKTYERLVETANRQRINPFVKEIFEQAENRRIAAKMVTGIEPKTY